MEPNAQGTQPDGTPAGSQAPENGVEKRINELTAQRYDEQRKREAAEAREQAYLAQIADLMGRQQAPAPQAPEVVVDPELKRQFDALMTPFQRQIEATLNQLQKVQTIGQIRQAAQGLPEPVQKLAEDITLQYAKQGYKIEHDMALDLAAGQFYRRQAAEQSAGRAATQRFNGGGVPVLTGQSLPNVAPVDPVKPDLDKMSLRERMAYWDSQPGLPL